PRLLLEVALVQLTHEAVQGDTTVILSRLDRLEHAVAQGAVTAPPASSPAAPAPVDPVTGRAELGGRVRRAVAASPSPASPAHTSPAQTSPAQTSPASSAPAQMSPAAPAPASSPETSGSTTAPATSGASPTAVSSAPSSSPPPPPASAGLPASAGDVRPTPTPSGESAAATAAARWGTDVLPLLRGLARPLFSAIKVLGERDGKLALGAPNDAHRARAANHLAEVEAAATKVVGAPVSVVLVVDGSAEPDDAYGDPGSSGTGTARVVPLKAKAPRASARLVEPVEQPGRPGRTAGDRDALAGSEPLLDDGACTAQDDADEIDSIDLSELTDVPPESVLGPVDRLMQAFPGSHEMDEH
ncbi:MAG: hypothetical protein ABIR68_17960, partial [Ilumatobacteraceae bacterium]